MTDLLTAAEMRAIEAAAIASGRTSGLDLMERAGEGVVEAVLDTWPKLAQGPHRAVVLCGPGNNGGDGFVIARLLRDRGWAVDLYLLGDPGRLPPDARENARRWLDGGAARPLSDFAPEALGRADLAVDALFGTGLARPLEGLSPVLAALAAAARRGAPPVVAVDLPSGLATDTGEVLTPADGGEGAAAASLTVTFHRPKRAHAMGAGPGRCGRIVVADIGLGPWDDRKGAAHVL